MMKSKFNLFKILMGFIFLFPQFSVAGNAASGKSTNSATPGFMKETDFPELPTYYQLMKLDEKTRKEYINGVISLMDYLQRRDEKFAGGTPNAFFPERTKNFLEILLNPSPAQALTCVKSCGADERMISDADGNYCILKQCPAGTKEAGTSCLMGGGCAHSCQLNCVPTYSFVGDANADQQKALQDGLEKRAAELRKKAEAAKTAQAADDAANAAQLKALEDAVNRKAEQRKKDLELERSNQGPAADGVTTAPSSTGQASVAPATKDAVTPAPSTSAQPSTTSENAPYGKSAPDDPYFKSNPGAMTPEQQKAEKSALDEQGKKRAAEKEQEKKCQPLACPDQDGQYRFKVKKDFDARVQETGNANCINGGLISKYDLAGRKKCRPVEKLKLGNMNLKCGSEQTMCSPLLFGLQKDSPATPFCVQVGIEVTKSCYDLSKGPEGAQKFWKNKDVTHEMLSDEWNKLREALKDLCTETRSANYHCVECAVIAKRLKELNKIADKCPEQNSCGQKIECSAWSRIKGLDENATGAASAGSTTAPAAPAGATKNSK